MIFFEQNSSQLQIEDRNLAKYLQLTREVLGESKKQIHEPTGWANVQITTLMLVF